MIEKLYEEKFYEARRMLLHDAKSEGSGKGLTFDESRRMLLHRAKTEGSGNGLTDIVKFYDKEIPRFLECLRKTEEESRKLRFILPRKSNFSRACDAVYRFYDSAINYFQRASFIN